jgi:hypothetical protein
MSLVLKALVALLAVAVAAVAVAVNGFMTGAWFGGLLYAALAAIVIHQWLTARNMNDEARAIVDRMFVVVFVVMALLARPALDSLETLAFG